MAFRFRPVFLTVLWTTALPAFSKHIARLPASDLFSSVYCSSLPRLIIFPEKHKLIKSPAYRLLFLIWLLLYMIIKSYYHDKIHEIEHPGHIQSYCEPFRSDQLSYHKDDQSEKNSHTIAQNSMN